MLHDHSSNECQPRGYIMATTTAEVRRLLFLISSLSCSFGARAEHGLLVVLDQLRQHVLGNPRQLLPRQQCAALSLYSFFISLCYCSLQALSQPTPAPLPRLLCRPRCRLPSPSSSRRHLRHAATRAPSPGKPRLSPTSSASSPVRCSRLLFICSMSHSRDLIISQVVSWRVRS